VYRKQTVAGVPKAVLLRHHGLHLIAVCSRTVAGGQMPSRDDIENRLFSQELALIQRRELRNLRNAAIISQPR